MTEPENLRTLDPEFANRTLEPEFANKVETLEDILDAHDLPCKITVLGYQRVVVIDVQIGEAIIPIHVRQKYISILGFAITHDKAHLIPQLLNETEAALRKTMETNDELFNT